MSRIRPESIRVGRGDLLRLLQTGGAENLRTNAHLAGFSPPPEQRKPSRMDLGTGIARPKPDPQQPEQQQLPEYTPPAVFPRIIERRPSTALPEPSGDSGEYPLPDWFRRIVPPDPDAFRAEEIDPPDKEDLVPWPRLWPRIKSLLSVTSGSRQPDIPALVDKVARVELVERIPKRRCRRWASSLIILVERSERLQIFDQDVDLLLERLALMRGDLGLQIQTVVDRPGGRVGIQIGKEYTERDWAPPPPGTTILVLSDLGLYAPGHRKPRRWLEFGENLSRRGFKPIVLLPLPEQWLPVEFAAAYTCICWDRSSSLRRARGQRNEHGPQPKDGQAAPLGFGHNDSALVLDLLAWLSPMVRVEPFLLRAARYLLVEHGAHVGHETLAWNHEDVERDSCGFSFREGAVQKYQRRFVELAGRFPRLAGTMCRLLIDAHRHLFPTRRYEELLILEALLGARFPENHRGELEVAKEHMQGLFKLMEGRDRYERSLQAYFAYLLQRQPERLMDRMQGYQAIWARLARHDGEVIIPESWDRASVLPFLKGAGGGDAKDNGHYLLLAQGRKQLRIVAEERYHLESEEFRVGVPMAGFTSRVGLVGITQGRDLRLKSLATPVCLDFGEQDFIRLHCGGEELTVELTARPPWASSMAMGGSMATSEDEDGEYRWYWNPAVTSQETTGETTLRGLWYPEPLEDPLKPPVPHWATACRRDQFGVAALAEIQGVKQWFRWIEPTRFLMGSPDKEKGRYDDEKLHPVLLTKGYWLAETACSQQLWKAVMRDNPSHFVGEDLPVERVSWNDVMAFLVKANSQQPDLQLRLPTEAEWENGCRAGTLTPFSFGDEPGLELLNYSGKWDFNEENHSEKGSPRKTEIVYHYQPNAWGLYQMHGNVWEWCADRFGEYPDGELVNPKGPDQGGGRVLRGGSWYGNGRYCRSACRFWYQPSNRDRVYGFRLARGQEPVRSLQGKGARQEGRETTGERARRTRGNRLAAGPESRRKTEKTAIGAFRDLFEDLVGKGRK